MADHQLNMILSVLINEIDGSLDTRQQLIHNYITLHYKLFLVAKVKKLQGPL